MAQAGEESTAMQESSAICQDEGVVSTSKDDKYVYRMDHKKRGYFIIFNNKTFDTVKRKPETDDDDGVEYLSQIFESLGFEVEIHDDQKRIEMLEELEEASQWDHSDCDCFGCAILTVGDERIVYGTDGDIPLQELAKKMNGLNCETLRGKPKIFLIQASKRDKNDDVSKTQADADEPSEDTVCRIPVEADYLYVYSTGSSFIKAMWKIIKHSEHVDLFQILTRVNHELASEQEKRNRLSIASTLTKNLILTKKKGK